MTYNKIYAQIGEERHIVLDPVNYQYDVKQILVISGETLPEYYEADICNVGDTATLTMIGTAADGVEIPDKFFRDGRNVLVYVVIPGSGGDVQTRYDITIPSDERGEREDIELDTDQQTQADSLIAALNSGVGRAEAAVTHYPKIVDGYWYVWNSETETWVNTGIRAEGQNGYSPEVTITEIEGGHRVTITDEDHPQGQTFDVMDGQGGSTGDYDELTNRPRINGHTLTGNQSAADLGLGTYSKPASGIPKTDLASDVQASLGKADTALQTAPVQSVAGKTGAVNLGAGDVGFNSSEEYNEGTVGAKLSALNRQLSDLEDTVSTTQIINSASGAIASFDDGADSMPIRKLVAQIEPVQDLHGYDNPWPAGGGKNKFQVTATTQTINGVTFTVNEDGTVLANGTATDNVGFVLGNASFLTGTESDTYILSGCPSGGSSSTYNVDVAGADGYDSGNGVTLRYQPTISNTATRIRIVTGTTVSNLVFKPIIRLATETDATFAPYENICPISGHTGAEIEQSGVNIWDEEWDIGHVDIVDGAFNSSPAYVRSKHKFRIDGGKTYYFACSRSGALGNTGISYYDANGDFISSIIIPVNSAFTAPAKSKMMAFFVPSSWYTGDYADDISINYPATDTAYRPYTGNQISVTFPTTIYYAEANAISGELTDYGYFATFDGSENWYATSADGKFFLGDFLPGQGIATDLDCISNIAKKGRSANLGVGEFVVRAFANSYAWLGFAMNPTDFPDVATFKAFLSSLYSAGTPVTVAVKLLIKTDYQLPGIALNTIYGTNNIWADTGDVEVTYPADTKLYIDGKLAEIQALVLENNG